MTSKPTPTVPVSSPVFEEDTSHFITRERSLSPLYVPRIQEYRTEESYTTASHQVSPSNSIPKKQIAIVNESMLFPSESPQPQEDIENALHGSSEFMLILYPEDETREEDAIDIENSAEIRSSISKYMNKSF